MAMDQKESYAMFTKEDWRTLLLNIWLAASYRGNMKASTSLKGWWPIIPYMRRYYSEKDLAKNHYDA